MNTYNVHVGTRYTTDIFVEANTMEEAIDIAQQNLDNIIVDEDFASDDYDAWVEDVSKFDYYTVWTKNGLEERIGRKESEDMEKEDIKEDCIANCVVEELKNKINNKEFDNETEECIQKLIDMNRILLKSLNVILSKADADTLNCFIKSISEFVK